MSHHWGYVGAVASAALFGIGATFNKIVLADVQPVVVAGLIYFFAGVSLSAIRFSPIHNRVKKLLKTPTKTDPKICRRDYFTLAMIVVSGSMIAPFLFLNGLNQTTAINASLLQNAESLFTVLIALTFMKEKARRKDWLGLTLLVAGAIFLTTNAEFYKLSLSQGLVGNILIIAACFFWGIDNNLSKFLCIKEDIILITTLKCLIGGTLLLALSYAFNLSFAVPALAFPYLFSVGALSIGFSILFFMLGLKEIGSMKTGVIFSTSSLFGALFAFIILREPLTIVQLGAGFLMLFAVYILYRKPV